MNALKVLIPAIAVACLASACKQENIMRATYRCENGMTIGVAFKDGKQVMITLEDGTETILPRIEAASGARYEGGDMEFWSKGVEAAWKPGRGAPPTMCRR